MRQIDFNTQRAVCKANDTVGIGGDYCVVAHGMTQSADAVALFFEGKGTRSRITSGARGAVENRVAHRAEAAASAVKNSIAEVRARDGCYRVALVSQILSESCVRADD